MVQVDEHASDTMWVAPQASRVSISAVLPAYNEAAVIRQTVEHVSDVLWRITPDFEIVVVDDGSRDNTAGVLAQLQQTEPSLHLKVVRHERNAGYGAALASGFDACTQELVFFTDGDKQFDVRELVGFLPHLTGPVDMVIGFRARRADPVLRLVNAWGWKFLVNTLFGYTARDVDCAFKLFRRQVWEELNVRSRGATFSAELLIKARRSGFIIVELPVTHYPRTAGQPTGARPRVIVRAFRELFGLRLSIERELAEQARGGRRTAVPKHVGA